MSHDPINIEYTVNYETIADVNEIPVKYGSLIIIFHPDNSSYRTPEYIYITQGSKYISFDYTLHVTPLACDSTDFSSGFLDYCRFYTNIKKRNEFYRILKNIVKQTENKMSRLPYLVIKKYYEFCCDAELYITDFYKEEMTPNLKSIEEIEKIGANCDCDLFSETSHHLCIRKSRKR